MKLKKSSLVVLCSLFYLGNSGTANSFEINCYRQSTSTLTTEIEVKEIESGKPNINTSEDKSALSLKKLKLISAFYQAGEDEKGNVEIEKDGSITTINEILERLVTSKINEKNINNVLFQFSFLELNTQNIVTLEYYSPKNYLITSDQGKSILEEGKINFNNNSLNEEIVGHNDCDLSN